MPTKPWTSALGPITTLLRAGKTDDALRRMRAESRKLRARSQDQLFLLHERCQLEVLGLEIERAVRSAEAILDRTRRYADLQRLGQPFFAQEFDFFSLPETYQAQVEAALTRYTEEFPDRPWGYYWGDVFRRMVGRQAENPRNVEKIVSFSTKRYGWMRYHTGLYHLHHEDFSRAIADLSIAARASTPGDWVAQCLVGEALLCEGDKPGALAAFRRAERIAPPEELGGVRAWRGGVLLWSGDYAEALKAAESGAKSGATFSHCWLGASLVKLERCREAIPHLKKAVALIPYDAEARCWLVEAHYRLGEPRAALREANAALRDYPRYCSFHVHALRGLIRGELGDEAGLADDFCRIPSRVVAYVDAKLGPRPDEETRQRDLLALLLELSRGLRRGSYENRIWMR